MPGPTPAEAWPDVFPLRVDLSPGESATVEFHVERNGFCGPIAVSAWNVPPNVAVNISSGAWPASVITIELTAADELSDDIRIVGVGASMGHEKRYEFTLRTRAAEADWSEAVVGVPGTEWVWDVVRLDDSRILVAGIYPESPDTNVAVVHCIEAGVGPCDDFGTDGVARLPEQAGLWGWGGYLRMERAPDGSALVAANSPTGQVLAHISSSGAVTILESAPEVVTMGNTNGLAVDATGRLLLRLVDDGCLYRLLPDGSPDTSLGPDGCLRIAPRGTGDVWTIPSGRMVTTSSASLVVLEEDGTPVRKFRIDTGADPYDDQDYGPQRFLPDESILLGMYECPSSGAYERCEGSVLHLDPYGRVIRRWELGRKVQPYAFAVRDGAPHVVANVRPGVLGVLPLGETDMPVPIVEGTVGSFYEHVAGWADYDDGRLTVIGTRWFGFGWREAFVWHE